MHSGNIVTRRSSVHCRDSPQFMLHQSRRRTSAGDDDDVAYWRPPPPSTLQRNNVSGRMELVEADDGDGGPPLQVDFRCACFKLTNISTVDFTTIVKFVMVFEWNDLRLRGASLTSNDLPVDLWGPDVVLENAQNECEVTYDSFSLLDGSTGRLKRTVTFHGPVYNPMDLEDFPFDRDELEMKFISICNWRTLDGSRYGNDPVRRIYTLRPMLDRKGVEFFFFGWGGKLNEFSILGWSHDVQNFEHEPSKPIIFKFDIHLVRKVQYYYLKILLPLWLLVLTSLAAYGIECDDLAGRLEVLVTLLLSTIAFLYIIQESIPKMSRLMVIDKVVIASLFSLVLAVLFSFLVSVLPHSATLNWILAAVNQLSYWVANLALVLPPQRRYKRYIDEMEARQATKILTMSGNLRPGMITNISKSEARLAVKTMKRQKTFGFERTSLPGDHENLNNSTLGFGRRFSSRRSMKEEPLRKDTKAVSSPSNGNGGKEDSEDNEEDGSTQTGNSFKGGIARARSVRFADGG